ncbi:hypothetical protein [Algoriphagus sp.]|uniref:hypothetical protein n=1 Tax=Algoriphagus sp. TaxID=1872435 RepID=UPI00391D423F
MMKWIWVIVLVGIVIADRMMMANRIWVAIWIGMAMAAETQGRASVLIRFPLIQFPHLILIDSPIQIDRE